MKKELFVFDWDGTVIDSAGKIIRCMQAAMAERGLPVSADEAVRDIIGLGLPEALRRLCPGLPEAEREALREAYARHFVDADQAPCSLFPGARETLETLRDEGVLLAVATGKSRRGLDRVLASSGLGHLFQATRCADETRSKPHPLMLHQLMRELAVSPGRTVMVGDTEYDMAMAREAGVVPVAVSYGAHSLQRLLQWQPALCIERMPQLCGWRPWPPLSQQH